MTDDKKTKTLKLLLITTIAVLAGYLVKASKEAYSGYSIQSVSGNNYMDKDMKKLLFFQSESSGLYLDTSNDSGGAKFFSYTIENGKICVTYDVDDDSDTLYLVKSGIYYQNKNLYFYLSL